jgi:hypothetical protein
MNSVSSFGDSAMGIERYKGFLISGSAVPTFATGFDWYSQGIILCPGRFSSIVEVKRIKGPIFHSKEAAEEHGFNLCKDRIDKCLDPPPTRRYGIR